MFISDLNGINNIYKKRIILEEKDTTKDVANIPAKPITNSLNGLYQLSASKDGKKLVFSTLYKGSYNLFLMNNPFEITLDTNKLVPTIYVSSLNSKESMIKEISNMAIHQIDSSKSNIVETDSTSQTDASHVYGDSVQIDFNNYVFGAKQTGTKSKVVDSTNSKFRLTNNLDKKWRLLS